MIAILGASGQLGTAFRTLLGDDALPVNRSGLDLGDLDAIRFWMGRYRPDVVINCAAYTAVDSAERDLAGARAINALAVEALARSAAEHGTTLVTFSTDYVFDGTKPSGYVESDPPSPLSVYGATKLEGEHLALEANSDALVVRTSWVVSGTHRSFASTMVELMGQGPVSVVDDQRGRPTLVDDLAPKVMEAVAVGATGLLHLANRGVSTWYDLAREVAGIAGLDPTRVQPISSDAYPRPALRPANSVLDSERLDDLGLTPLPHYLAALEEAVEMIMARQAG